MKESPLFVRAHDLVVWLIPQAQKFPRAHRFGLGERMQNTVLDFQALLIAAGKSQSLERKAYLLQADIRLAQLKHWGRACLELRLWSVGQYQHCARLLEECGRLLGAWVKTL
jgi:hypothetical protein